MLTPTTAPITPTEGILFNTNAKIQPTRASIGKIIIQYNITKNSYYI